MAQPDFTLNIRSGQLPSTIVIAPHGPLVLEHLFKFQDAWRNAVGDLLIFDLSGVTYLDSAAIGSLVNAHVSCSNRGRKMALVGAGDRVGQMLIVTRVNTLFRFFPDVAAAEQALSSQSAGA